MTFALGTAVGNWTLGIAAWGPGTSVLLLVGTALAWRMGANAVLSF